MDLQKLRSVCFSVEYSLKEKIVEFDEFVSLVAHSKWATDNNLSSKKIKNELLDLKIKSAYLKDIIKKSESLIEVKEEIKEEVKEEIKEIIQESKIRTYTEGGKGRKKCPSCEQFLSLVYKICQCGFDFSKSKKVEEVVDKIYEKALHDGCKTIILIPAGSCPIVLKSSKIKDVKIWADSLRDEFNNRQQFLSITGLIYFIGQFFKVLDPERDIAIENIKKVFAEEF